MSDELPAAFWEGVSQFNNRQFYDCHDTLEALWMEAIEPDKTFYQGILQIAVALYHLGNRNARGATILLGEGSNRLRRYLPSYGEIDVAALLEQSQALLSQLQQAPPEQIEIWAQQLSQPERQPARQAAFVPPAIVRLPAAI